MPTGYPMRHLYTGAGAEEVRRLYAEEGKAAWQIAESLGCSTAVIQRVLVANGVDRRPSGMVGRRHTQEAKDAVGRANSSRQPGDRGWLTTDGYVMVYYPSHPHADHSGCVREHRIVMEWLIGRFLKPSEVVHHINGNKADNHWKNLELFSSSGEHSKSHAVKAGKQLHPPKVRYKMRLWTVPPSSMCRQHLLGEHVETHMIVGSLNRGLSLDGYYAQGLIDTRLIRARHDALVKEMEARGYRHGSPLPEFEDPGRGSLNGETPQTRCAACRERDIP